MMILVYIRSYFMSFLKILAKERRLKVENTRMKKEIQRLASQDKKEKHKYYSDEAHKRIQYLQDQIEKAKKEATSAKQVSIYYFIRLLFENFTRIIETIEPQHCYCCPICYEERFVYYPLRG